VCVATEICEIWCCQCVYADIQGKQTIEMLHDFLLAALDQVQIHSNVRSTDPPCLETPFVRLEDPTA